MWKSVSIRVLIVIVSRPRLTEPLGGHRLAGIAQHVEEYLTELRLVGQDVGQAGIEAEL